MSDFVIPRQARVIILFWNKVPYDVQHRTSTSTHAKLKLEQVAPTKKREVLRLDTIKGLELLYFEVIYLGSRHRYLYFIRSLKNSYLLKRFYRSSLQCLRGVWIWSLKRIRRCVGYVAFVLSAKTLKRSISPLEFLLFLIRLRFNPQNMEYDAIESKWKWKSH